MMATGRQNATLKFPNLDDIMDSQHASPAPSDTVWALDLASEAEPTVVSETHATVIGLLCAHPSINAETILRQLDALDGEGLEADDADARAEQAKALEPVIAGLHQRLDSMDMSFQPLLPADDQPLAQRTQCLAHWCTGFLTGFAAGQGELDSQDAQEAAGLLGEIARAVTDSDAETEDEEVAYAELVEFVRMAVLMLHAECRARQ
jgi:uncharacterized protein YgfB (UPF0149 family)